MINFNNKRFTPFTDEFRTRNEYGVYDNERNCKIRTCPTYEMAISQSILFNENLEKIPVGLQFYDPTYGIPFYDQHLPMTGFSTADMIYSITSSGRSGW